MGEEWGPWIEHDGKGCPVVGQYVQVERRNGCVTCIIAGSQCLMFGVDPSGPLSGWVWAGPLRKPTEVLRYRVRKPRGLTILERIVQHPERADA